MKSHRAPSTPVCMGGIHYYDNTSLSISKLRFLSNLDHLTNKKTPHECSFLT